MSLSHPIRSLSSLLLTLGLTSLGTSSVAQPAIYRDGLLELPQGIVIETGDDQYYSDIRLRADANGALRIVSAEPRPLLTLTELTLDQVYGSTPAVSLQVSGMLPMPCMQLEPLAIRRIGNTFHVLIAQGGPDPLALCAQVLTPVELTVDLDVADLPAGDYVALINNEPMEFTIEE